MNFHSNPLVLPFLFFLLTGSILFHAQAQTVRFWYHFDNADNLFAFIRMIEETLITFLHRHQIQFRQMIAHAIPMRAFGPRFHLLVP